MICLTREEREARVNICADLYKSALLAFVKAARDISRYKVGAQSNTTKAAMSKRWWAFLIHIDVDKVKIL